MSNETISGDLMVNNLVYKMPALSLATNRTFKRQYFQRRNYSASETAVIELNTGSSYVKACNSYLTFSVALTGASSTANFGNGSAINLIENIIVKTRSGTELDRIDRVNLWSAKDIRHTHSQSWIEKYGTQLGLGTTGIAGTDAANLSTTATKFVIPLSLLSGFFRPVGNKLIPPTLASGMEIRLNLADYRTSFFQKANTTTSYEITDISIMCDCVDLSDSTQKTLNVESSQSGLEYVYPRIYTTTSAVLSTAINHQVRKAVSQATHVSGALLTQGNILDVTKDSLKSETFNVDKWQYRLGSLYFPNESYESGANGLESFMSAQVAYDKPKHDHSENAVSLTDFVTNGYGVMAVSLEKDQQLNLSGLPINNSRVLELQATLASYSAAIELVIFLEYIGVVRSYIDNAISSI